MTEPTNLETETSRAAGKYLTFVLAGEEYGIGILKVQEIIGFQPITPVPGVGKYIEGVFNLRGKIIPVIDLRVKFGMERQERTRETCIIVVESRELKVGIVVDAVSEVRDVKADELEAMPNLGFEEESEYFLGICKANGKVRFLLDIDHVLASEDILALRRL
jgi:purine-binding chemotaxis protein CheW